MIAKVIIFKGVKQPPAIVMPTDIRLRVSTRATLESEKLNSEWCLWKNSAPTWLFLT